MSVYLVVEGKVKHQEKYKEYIAAVSEIIASHKGRYLVHDGKVTPLFEGRELERRNPEKVLIVEFPTAADHRRCFTSPEYQAIVPLRDAAAEFRAVLLEGYVPEKR
jgi:uncharacterized protein (DUF1330 family)